MRRKGNYVLKPTFSIHFAFKFWTESVITNDVDMANIFLFFTHKIKKHSFLNVSSIDICEGSNISKRE